MAPQTINNNSTVQLIGQTDSAIAVQKSMGEKEHSALDSAKMVDDQIIDHNHNEVLSVEPSTEAPECCEKPAAERNEVFKPASVPNRTINDRTRKMIENMFNKHLSTNLNVLVLGQRESGKSSFINSMAMSLSQKWSDKAKYCPGRNHIIDECVMHKNTSGGKVVFWDTRGFEDIHELDHAVLILRYVLEGRIPAKCIPCVLLMNKELIKKRYHRTFDSNRRIDCILFVSALDEDPPTHLMSIVQQAVATSKHVSVNRIPIISATTKSDLLSTERVEQLENSRGYLNYSLEHYVSRNDPNRMEYNPRRVVNYSCELEPFSDESANPSSMTPSAERDTPLLAVWRDIISRTTACGDRRKRAYSSPTSSRAQMCSCLPFRLDYNRLRSGSF